MDPAWAAAAPCPATHPLRMAHAFILPGAAIVSKVLRASGGGAAVSSTPAALSGPPRRHRTERARPSPVAVAVISKAIGEEVAKDAHVAPAMPDRRPCSRSEVRQLQEPDIERGAPGNQRPPGRSVANVGSMRGPFKFAHKSSWGRFGADRGRSVASAWHRHGIGPGSIRDGSWAISGRARAKSTRICSGISQNARRNAGASTPHLHRWRRRRRIECPGRRRPTSRRSRSRGAWGATRCSRVGTEEERLRGVRGAAGQRRRRGAAERRPQGGRGTAEAAAKRRRISRPTSEQRRRGAGGRAAGATRRPSNGKATTE